VRRSRAEELPAGLPAPVDDGACDHLPGALVPRLVLPSTAGGTVDLGDPDTPLTIVYAYPRTGVPGEADSAAWDAIPGARGCTPQTCAYRDAHARFAELGIRVFGLSTQTTAYQRELAERLGLPNPVLSDAALELTRALRLPTFEFHGETLLRRVTFVIERGRIEHVFYPVFPPDRDPETVLAWFAERGG
jgi:peroxiredoxin